MGDERSLGHGWTLTLSKAGAYAGPHDIPHDAERVSAPVPGTVAQALRASGRFDAASATVDWAGLDRADTLETIDAWYELDLVGEPAGPAILHFDGLATVAEVFLDGVPILASDSMFEAHDVPVLLKAASRLALGFRAIGPHLDRSGPRARWRPRMMRSQGLRLLRTTALGFMPGWCPDVVAVGPWRPVSLRRQTAGRPQPRDIRLSAELSDKGEGVLTADFASDHDAAGLLLVCDGHETPFTLSDGRFRAQLRLAGAKAWWPHTHGEPALYDVTVKDEAGERRLARTGFRRIDIDRGEDGHDFAVRINGAPIFCRGAVWTSADIVSLPGGRDDYAPWLRLAAEAGMNMIRIPGIAAYESAEFFALCDELGIMVWQDLMFANFDYPAKDEGFLIHVKTEIRQLLDRLAASPSLTILCGGSEIFQQAAMLGLPERLWKVALATDILADACRAGRPDVAYVDNSPSGGALPFFPNSGVAHYYGVGAYCRPLDDARRADVRFAAECLAFAYVPDAETLAQHLPVAAVHDPRWKARVPRDIGASWDFEDVRDHYLRDLYDLDPARLRYEDPDRYLSFSRAVTAQVLEATFGEWRRPTSGCNGALVWTLQDLLPGAGWGVIDATGRPKSAWHALKRAFRPLQVMLSDEGTNGLDVHVVNDSPGSRQVRLELVCLRDGHQPVVSGNRALTLDPRSGLTLAATDLFGAFFDTTYAYRFGPPSHDVTVARLKDADGTVLAEAFHFPLGRARALREATIAASLTRSETGGLALQLQTDRLAQSVTISVDGYRPAENGFHLAPGMVKQVVLVALAGAEAQRGLVSQQSLEDGLPSGSIVSLGNARETRF